MLNWIKKFYDSKFAEIPYEIIRRTVAYSALVFATYQLQLIEPLVQLWPLFFGLFWLYLLQGVVEIFGIGFDSAKKKEKQQEICKFIDYKEAIKENREEMEKTLKKILNENKEEMETLSQNMQNQSGKMGEAISEYTKAINGLDSKLEKIFRL